MFDNLLNINKKTCGSEIFILLFSKKGVKMSFKNINKKAIFAGLVAFLLFVTASYLGVVTSGYKINKENAGNLKKEKTANLISASNDKKSTYYSYSAFDEKFYGPFDRENVKKGDFYVKIGIPQGSGGYSLFQYFNKNKELLNADKKGLCSFGPFLYSNNNLYMENAGQLYKIHPESDFVCFPIRDDEYVKLSVKRILLSDLKNGDKVDVSGYEYFYFDKYVSPNYLNGVQFAPKKNEEIKAKVFYFAEDNKTQERQIDFAITSKK